MATSRFRLSRIHIWLGWMAGVPLLLWTVSGLWMVARPIEEVRGEHLRAEPPVLRLETPPVPPPLFPAFRPVKNIALEQQPNGPVWIVGFADGGMRRASAADGRWLPPVALSEAREAALKAYKGRAAIESVKRFAANASPIDLRRERPAWQVHFADGANVYIDAETGQFLALRTRQWRAFDFMWGLHILDPGQREDTSHPLLIVLATLATASAALGLYLLPGTIRRRAKSAEPNPAAPAHKA